MSADFGELEAQTIRQLKSGSPEQMEMALERFKSATVSLNQNSIAAVAEVATSPALLDNRGELSDSITASAFVLLMKSGQIGIDALIEQAQSPELDRSRSAINLLVPFCSGTGPQLAIVISKNQAVKLASAANAHLVTLASRGIEDIEVVSEIEDVLKYLDKVIEGYGV